jgi:hypothetical protein
VRLAGKEINGNTHFIAVGEEKAGEMRNLTVFLTVLRCHKT